MSLSVWGTDMRRLSFRRLNNKVHRLVSLHEESSFQRKCLQGHTPATDQLFILGLPRSGTTLLDQYIVHRKDVAYFTNGVGDNPSQPCLTSSRQRLENPPYISDFASRYGRSEGPMAP